ncbi:MAG: aldo/keto reductase, partial [Reyranella sp.]|nr:aldo/keto reductase [Reyranella sp.]
KSFIVRYNEQAIWHCPAYRRNREGSFQASTTARIIRLDADLAPVESLRAIAKDLGASPAQVAIDWVTAQGNDIVPLVGARCHDRLNEALGALEVKLTAAHLTALAKTFPHGAAAGERYPQAQRAHMDSEKKHA